MDEKLSKVKQIITICKIVVIGVVVLWLIKIGFAKFTMRFGEGISRGSRPNEALSMVSFLRTNIEKCYLEKKEYSQCDSFEELDVKDPQFSHYSYKIEPLFSKDGFKITATRNNLACSKDQNCPGNQGDTITLVKSPEGIKRMGTGVFSVLH